MSHLLVVTCAAGPGTGSSVPVVNCVAGSGTGSPVPVGCAGDRRPGPLYTAMPLQQQFRTLLDLGAPVSLVLAIALLLQRARKVRATAHRIWTC